MTDKTINLFDGDDRGQVGIGTLIVFIALVLVAAIAAGVLINTAGLLQAQSEQTGEETQDQVANNIEIVSTVGTYDDGSDAIDNVELLLQKSAGADVIDLEGLVVEVIDSDGVERFEVTDSELENVAGEDETVLIERSDRVELTIDQISLGAGEEAEITISSEDGSQRFVNVRAPSSFATLDDNEQIRV